jgi:hypothetical protein
MQDLPDWCQAGRDVQACPRSLLSGAPATAALDVLNAKCHFLSESAARLGEMLAVQHGPTMFERIDIWIRVCIDKVAIYGGYRRPVGRLALVSEVPKVLINAGPRRGRERRFNVNQSQCLIMNWNVLLGNFA